MFPDKYAPPCYAFNHSTDKGTVKNRKLQEQRAQRKYIKEVDEERMRRAAIINAAQDWAVEAEWKHEVEWKEMDEPPTQDQELEALQHIWQSMVHQTVVQQMDDELLEDMEGVKLEEVVE